MSEMSDWARELAAEVKAAAPNAPEPVYRTDDSAEWLTWTRNGRPVAVADNCADGEDFWPTPIKSERPEFVRLVAEMWP